MKTQDSVQEFVEKELTNVESTIGLIESALSNNSKEEALLHIRQLKLRIEQALEKLEGK